MQRKQTEPHMSTYLHSKGGKLGFPISGNFELTARCNFDCPMCYVHMKQEDIEAQGKELTAGQWIEIAKDAKERGMVFALLTGGEPFVRKDFFEIYDAMKEMGLLVSINTNGSMLSGAIRDRLLENPPCRMNVSLYGGCNQTYESMCGKPVFDQVVENVRILKSAGVDISLNLSITPYNCQDLLKIYEIAKELEVNVRAASYMYPPIRVNGEKFGCGNRLSAEDAAKYSVQWDKLRFTEEEFSQRASAMENLCAVEQKECSVDMEHGVGCRAGKSSFWVTWDGRMIPCGMMPEPIVYPLEVGFDKAWEELRRRTKEIRLPGKCKICSHKEICPVCAAVCVTETGTFDGVPEYVCRQTKETVKLTVEMARENIAFE